ncbi:retrovirus-related pol polyprotein from transposon TNT 1-94 [Tanacetum coccineum]|uniref:Retrovirus-related pol polyprotein from transposon TNT 1-94 n=1 Tax=Tanacetum coccineum TaxID=301880 RepID=A0ABQ4Y594_9ASTR
MSNSNTNLQTQSSNALHNAIMEAGSKDRPPMLHCLQNPPYIYQWAEKTVPVAEGIDNDIYSTVDACPNACEMWKAIERLKQGESINVQDLETNLYWEFGKFTSRDENHLNRITTRYEMSKEKEIDKLMALISLSFKKIYKPTNNNLRTSSNTSRANQDNSPRTNRGTGYDNQRAINVVGLGKMEYYYADHMNAILGIYTDLDEFTDLQCDYGETLEKCERLEKELSKSRKMSKSFESLQKHAINLELELQQCKEKIKNDKSFKENQSNVFLKEREQYFEIQDLKAQLQDKGIAICELKKLIEKMKGKSVETKFEKSSVIRQPNAFKSQRQSILGKPTIFSDSLAKKDFSKSKPVTTQNVSNDFSKPVTAQILPQNKLPIVRNTNVIAPGIKNHSLSNRLEDIDQSNNSQGKKQEVEDHSRNFTFSNNKTFVTACNDNLNAKTSNVNFVYVTCGKCVLNDNHDLCVLHYINGVNLGQQQMAVPVRTQNPRHDLVEIILFIVDSGCSKHMTGNLKLLTNFVEKFLGTVKFGNDQIAPILGYGDLGFKDNSIKRGNIFSKGSRGTYVFHFSSRLNFTQSNFALMAKATSLKHGYGIKALMEKEYVLVMMMTSPEYTWTHFLRSKDETPGVLIDFLTLVQRGLHAQVTTVRTDKGTEFLNKSLHAYFCKRGNRHKRPSCRTKPEQKRDVERRNRTLVEALDTMLTQVLSVFGSLCYIIIDSRKSDKMKEKDHVSSDPAPQCSTTVLEQDSLSPGPQSQENVPQVAETVTTSNELELPL